MNGKTSQTDRTVILSDEYLSESGVQGGKIIAEHIPLGCVIIGIPLLIIGIFSLCYSVFVIGFPKDISLIFIILTPQSLIIIIGVLLIIGGYLNYRDKHEKKISENH